MIIVYWDKELSFVWMEDDDRLNRCSRERRLVLKGREWRNLMMLKKKGNYVAFLDCLLRDDDVFYGMVNYCSSLLDYLFVYFFLDRYTSMVIIDEKNHQNGS